MQLTHPDGSLEIVTAPDHCHAAVAAVLERAKVKRTEAFRDDDAIDLSGWIDYTGWYPRDKDIPITFFNGTYSVPDTPAPETQGSEVLYWFIGMQNNADSETRILQPVLTFNGPQGGAEGEPEGWSFTSWNCCPQGQAWYSSPITGFERGDLLVGEMVAAQDLNSYTITSTIPGKNSTTITVDTTGLTFDWADVTLEVYDVDTCAKFPKDAVAFADMHILGAQGQSLVPQWDVVTGSQCDGTTTVVDPTKLVTIQCDPTASMSG